MDSPRLGVATALFLVVLLVALSASTQEPSPAEQILIERCDRLPVVTVRIDGAEMRFLLDTAATSMLNVKSFPKGRSKEIRVSSWSGETVTSAREVTLPELALGRYRLIQIKLPAIDLSPIGKACGGQIDGILGVDLLEKMGAVIDMKRQVLLFGTGVYGSGRDSLLQQFRANQQACIAAFNRGDAQFFEGCLDPEVVLFTPWGEVRGGQEMLLYLGQRYFNLEPPAQIELRPRNFRVLGDAVWYEYDYSIKLPDAVIEARGMAICRKTGGRWRLLNMHNSLRHTEKLP
jgi:hypothetical protein